MPEESRQIHLHPIPEPEPEPAFSSVNGWFTALRTAFMTACFTLILLFGASYFTLRDTVRDLQAGQRNILDTMSLGKRFTLDDGIDLLIATELDVQADLSKDSSLYAESQRRLTELRARLVQRRVQSEDMQTLPGAHFEAQVLLSQKEESTNASNK